jgi:hypothetical protein
VTSGHGGQRGGWRFLALVESFLEQGVLDGDRALGTDVWREEAKFRGTELLARGFFVSTVGRDEAVIREYIKPIVTGIAHVEGFIGYDEKNLKWPRFTRNPDKRRPRRVLSSAQFALRGNLPSRPPSVPTSRSRKSLW